MKATRRITKAMLHLDLARLAMVLSMLAVLPWLMVSVGSINIVRSLMPGTAVSQWSVRSDVFLAVYFILALSGYGLTVGLSLTVTTRLRQKKLAQWVERITGVQHNPQVDEDFEELRVLNPIIYGIMMRVYDASARLRALNDINQRINSSMQIEVMLPEITKSAVELLCATAGAVVLRDENGAWQNVAGYNFPAEIVYKNVPKSLGLAAEVVERGTPVILEDYSKYERRVPLLDQCGFRATIGVPLITDGRRIGALCVGTSDPSRRFGDPEVDLLSSFANQAALAIKNARLYSENLRRLEDLRQAKKELDRTTAQLRSLLSKTFENQEEIRRRIAADIHDGLTQLVVGALYQIQSVRPVITSKPHGYEEVTLKRLEVAHGLLSQTIDEMYRVVYDLRPASIDEIGLVHSLDRYLDRFQEASAIHCHLEVIGPERRLGVEQEMAVYRILQEALNNIRKHSNALSAEVCVQFYSDSIGAVIRDNGAGFDKTAVLRSDGQHLGIIDMQERAYSIGGHFEIVSAPAQGTTVRIQIPTKPQDATVGESERADSDGV